MHKEAELAESCGVWNMFLPEDVWRHLEVDLKLLFDQDTDELHGAFGRTI